MEEVEDEKARALGCMALMFSGVVFWIALIALVVVLFD